MKSDRNISIITETESVSQVTLAARQVAVSDPLSGLVGEETSEVVMLDAHRPLGQLVRALAGEQERDEELIAKLLPARVRTPAATEQLRLNAQAREAFIAEFPAFSAAELASLAGNRWANRGAWASRLAKEGRVFSIDYDGRRFPAFQFDSDWRPRPLVHTVLERLHDAGVEGWSVALWWTSANGWLDGERPVDLIDGPPEPIVAAAGQVGIFPF